MMPKEKYFNDCVRTGSDPKEGEGTQSNIYIYIGALLERLNLRRTKERNNDSES